MQDISTGPFTHIVNLGIEKRLIFMDQKDLDRFFELLSYYRFQNQPSRFSFRKRPAYQQKHLLTPSVSILCYAMMPDHFHLVLKEATEGSMKKFLSHVTNSYTKYFNARHKRAGPLFQGTFKRYTINDTDALLKVSAFIHTEPLRNGIVKDLNKFPFSSFSEYTGGMRGFCDKTVILSHFPTNADYTKYLSEAHSFVPKDLFLDK